MKCCIYSINDNFSRELNFIAKRSYGGLQLVCVRLNFNLLKLAHTITIHMQH
jgi:hypothetical protein